VPKDLKGDFTAKVEYDTAPFKSTMRETRFTIK
jgi:hypothetical protein